MQHRYFRFLFRTVIFVYLLSLSLLLFQHGLLQNDLLIIGIPFKIIIVLQLKFFLFLNLISERTQEHFRLTIGLGRQLVIHRVASNCLPGVTIPAILPLIAEKWILRHQVFQKWIGVQKYICLIFLLQIIWGDIIGVGVIIVGSLLCWIILVSDCQTPEHCSSHGYLQAWSHVARVEILLGTWARGILFFFGPTWNCFFTLA